MSQLEDLLQQCTVKLSFPDQMNWGTGFFVASSLILTCAHVVRERQGQLVQIWWQKRELEAVVEQLLPDPYDLALLRVILPPDANPVCVYLDKEISSRDPLYLFGYPDQDFPNGCPATFECEGLTGDEPPLIKFALGQVRPGMSGSPLLNQRTGKVCGIVKFTRDRSFDLGGGAVPSTVILTQFPELVELQRSFHQGNQRWFQGMVGAISANSAISPLIRATLSLSAYDAATWVGRNSLITSLSQKLQAGHRILAIMGITGIGKTALAERLVVEFYNKSASFHRLNFDDRGQGCDFLSGALTLLPKLGEAVTIEDQKDPENALKHLLQVLREKQFLVQLDSLEMLLQGDDQTGWNAFVDPLWVDFFQQLLAGETCQSQLLLTTQALSEELEIVGTRYSRYWYRQDLGGLSELEQLQLFEKNGLKSDETGTEILKQIGTLYQGHPLVLQVIVTDVLDKPFNGNVQQYWKRYQAEFDEMEQDKQKNSPRALQLRVKQRVEQSLKRLSPDAHQLLCRSSVYRRPVPEEFWLAMVGGLSEDKQRAALDLLKSHNLVEEELRGDGVLLLRQHNLIRSVARQSLKTDDKEWQAAERTAANVWLNDYEPEPDTPNLEQVRGYLESFYHYCELEDWESAKAILIDQELGVRLQTWGYFREMLPLYQQVLGNTDASIDMVCERGIGNAYWYLSRYPQAVEHHQQSLMIACRIGDYAGEGVAMSNLGATYLSVGNYPQAIEYYQQAADIAHKICDFEAEGRSLANLGIVYLSLGNSLQAIEYYQQALRIAHTVRDRMGEGRALGYMGFAYCRLGNYQQAIEYQQQKLAIDREIGDRQEEGWALGNLGITCQSLGNYQQAIEYHQQQLMIACEVGDRRGEGSAQGGLGAAYRSLGDHQQAIEHHQQWLSIACEIGDRWGEGRALLDWGITLVNLEQYSEAQQCLQTSLKIFSALRDRANEAEALLRHGELYYKTDQPALAREFCDRALSIASELGIPLVKACEELQVLLAPDADAGE